MSAPQSHGHAEPQSFAFTPENKAEAEKIIARYPAGRQQSAVMGLLWLAVIYGQSRRPLALACALGVVLGLCAGQRSNLALLGPGEHYAREVAGDSPSQAMAARIASLSNASLISWP